MICRKSKDFKWQDDSSAESLCSNSADKLFCLFGSGSTVGKV